MIYLGSESEAIDAVDEAAFLAWDSLSSLRKASSFAAWLHRILVNCCYKTLRQRKKSYMTCKSLI